MASFTIISAVSACVFSVLMVLSVHKIDEGNAHTLHYECIIIITPSFAGHVAVYYRVSQMVTMAIENHVSWYFLQGGALLNGINNPGFHTMIPLVTSYVSVQVYIYIKDLMCTE